MRKSHGLFILLMLLIASLSVTSCLEIQESTDKKAQRQQEQIMKEVKNELGLPNIVNFQEKRTLKLLYEQRDRTDLVCYAYTYVPMTGKFVYIGKTLGYGIPYSAQYSNPEKIVDYCGSASCRSMGTLPQPEPNGIWTPTSSDATFLMLYNEKTKEYEPVYMEPRIVVSPFKLPARLVQK